MSTLTPPLTAETPPPAQRLLYERLPVERLLQVGIAALAAMGTLLLGMGERDATLPVLAIIVSVSSVYLTDVRGWFMLKPGWADAAGLLAVFMAIYDFQRYDAENRLLAVANLLVYLQFVLQFQRKSIRSYWLLGVLSLMQVAVATALNLAVVFGGLLVVYMVVGLITLTVFFLYRETNQYRGVQSTFMPVGFRQRRAVGAVTANNAPSRWPLAAVQASFSSRETEPLGPRILSWSLGRQIIGITCATLVLTMIMFLVVPRSGRVAWRQQAFAAPQSTTGFEESVSLGSMRQAISEDDSEVMRVRFFRHDTGLPYNVQQDTLFRGVVLTDYDAEQHQWRRPRGQSMQEMPRQIALPEGEWVRQEIALQRLDTRVLFAVYPVVNHETLNNGNDLHWDFEQHLLQRGDRSRDPVFHYSLLTNGFVNGDQVPFTLDRDGLRPGEQFSLTRLPGSIDGQPPLERLEQLAAEIVRDIPESQPYERALALERYLAFNGGFDYSLSEQVVETGEDPIEYFLFTSRQGHCEYFASALTLMLRSIGLPSRLVVGYKGGEVNNWGNYLIVRQLHAHAWVEVYLTNDQLPELATAGSSEDVPFAADDLPDPSLPDFSLPAAADDLLPEGTQGAWLRLDPTPGAGPVQTPSFASQSWSSMRDFYEYLSYLWSQYILGMDARRQREAIYGPIVSTITNFTDWVSNPDTWRAIIRVTEWDFRKWFNWRAGLAAMLLSGAALGMVRLLWPRMKRLRGWLFRNRSGTADSEVEFYRRLEQLLRRNHLQRQQWQTPREFALYAGGQLAEDPRTTAVAGVPRRVAEALYRVRYGKRPLDGPEAQAVEQVLSDLETALTQRP